MLSNIPREVMLFVFIAGLVVFGAAVIGAVIWAIVSVIKGKRSYSKCVGLLTAISVVIVIASWFFNFGWLRLAMTFLLIPVIHGIAYIVSNILFSTHTEKSPWLVKANIFYIITYMLPYIFLPDGGDIGQMYFFFGLVRNDLLSSIALGASAIFALAHVALFVLQIVLIIVIKRKEKQKNLPAE